MVGQNSSNCLGAAPVRQSMKRNTDTVESQQLPQRDVEELRLTMRKLNEIAASDRNQRQIMMTSPNNGGSASSNGNVMKISSVAKLKSYSIRMIKALKEDLAKI